MCREVHPLRMHLPRAYLRYESPVGTFETCGIRPAGAIGIAAPRKIRLAAGQLPGT